MIRAFGCRGLGRGVSGLLFVTVLMTALMLPVPASSILFGDEPAFLADVRGRADEGRVRYSL